MKALFSTYVIGAMLFVAGVIHVYSALGHFLVR